MNETNKVYIDIQSLLDIRQSMLVELLGKDKAVDYVSSQAYYLRDQDRFEVDPEAWGSLVRSKDPRVLANATVSYMVVLLTRHLSQMEKLNAFNNENASSELVVNTYPYVFSESEGQAFRNGIFMKLGVPVVITLVCEPLAVWTPSFIKHSGIRQFYCYDASGWFGIHAEQIAAGALRETRVFFPSLGYCTLDKNEIKEFQKLGFTDIFGYTEYLFAAYVRIQFLPVVFYSNLVTATAALEQFNEELKQTPLSTGEPESSPPKD